MLRKGLPRDPGALAPSSSGGKRASINATTDGWRNVFNLKGTQINKFSVFTRILVQSNSKMYIPNQIILPFNCR